MSQEKKDDKAFEHRELTRPDIIHILSFSPNWERMTQEEKLQMVREYEIINKKD